MKIKEEEKAIIMELTHMEPGGKEDLYINMVNVFQHFSPAV